MFQRQLEREIASDREQRERTEKERDKKGSGQEESKVKETISYIIRRILHRDRRARAALDRRLSPVRQPHAHADKRRRHARPRARNAVVQVGRRARDGSGGAGDGVATVAPRLAAALQRVLREARQLGLRRQLQRRQLLLRGVLRARRILGARRWRYDCLWRRRRRLRTQ